MRFTNKKRNDSKGFTLVETLVAVLMLSVIMVAITSLLTRSLQAIATSQDYFIASKIALEGMEMVRAIRNNNLIASGPDTDGNPNNDVRWNTALLNGTYEFDHDTIENYVPGSSVFPVLNNSPRRLCMSTSDSSAGRYTYTNSPDCTGTGTQPLQGNFTRTITISDPPNPGDPWLQVTVTVTSGSLSDYVLTTTMFNAS